MTSTSTGRFTGDWSSAHCHADHLYPVLRRAHRILCTSPSRIAPNTSCALPDQSAAPGQSQRDTHFFLPPPAAASSLRSHEMTLPSITTPLPSMNATRERPSQFLKVSHTRGCCGWKLHCAISFDLSACGSSIFLPPVSLPIFHLSFEIRHADRPHRTKPIGE